jgi:(p)ppGpp synthase/HD superfamily hydrolase
VSDLVTRAIDFAAKAHEGQRRKYTDEPYINHPLAVLRLVQSVGASEEAQAAAVLHDVVEDCGVEFETLNKTFGAPVSWLVWALTECRHRPSNPQFDGVDHYNPKMNRKARKEIDRQHLAASNSEAQTIKLADIIDNTSSIREHDPSFAKVYLAEVRELLKVLTKGNRSLWERADEITK